MTRKEIEYMREVVLPYVKIKLLKIDYENFSESDAEEFTKDFNEILNLAIKALEQESQSFKWCTDCKEYDQEKHCCHRYSKVIRDTVAEIEQEPRKGHWEHGKEICREYRGQTLVNIDYLDWHCSNCHCVIEQSIKPKWNYCPNCGADMRGEKE